MKVNVVKSSNDERDYYSIETEQFELEFMDGEPEDACLRRDFRGVYLIPKLMELAYNAGENGEKLEFLEQDIAWEDLW